MGTWYTGSTAGLTAAHECGHMLGLYDEYAAEETCPDRNPIDNPALMGSGSIVRSRYLKRIASLIESELVSL
jgi:M6 family metalloprotease-like protein